LIPVEKKGELVRLAVLALGAAVLWPSGSSDSPLLKCILVSAVTFAAFRPPNVQALKDFWAKAWHPSGFIIFGILSLCLLGKKVVFFSKSNDPYSYKGYRHSRLPTSPDTLPPARTATAFPSPNDSSAPADWSNQVRWEDSHMYKKYRDRLKRLKHEPSQLEKILVAKSVLSEDQPEMLTGMSDARVVEYVETGK
jgi:hypothetical protein